MEAVTGQTQSADRPAHGNYPRNNDTAQYRLQQYVAGEAEGTRVYGTVRTYVRE